MAKGYLDYVRALPCCVTSSHCDMSDPHHIKGYNHLTGAGIGKKGHDLLAIPLRHDLHTELHQIGSASWEEKHNVDQLEEAVKTIIRAYDDGFLIVNPKYRGEI